MTDKSYEVRVAVVAADLPPFEPPLGRSGFDTRYEDRAATSFEVTGATTLDQVYRQAITDLAPKVVPEFDFDGEPYDVVRWVWFYEPADADGISGQKAWEIAQDVIAVAEDGTARWNRSADQLTIADLMRAANNGTLRGDPLKPYLVLLLPQGGEAWQTAWDVAVRAWELTSSFLTARELTNLVRGVHRERLRRSVEDGLDVVAKHRDQWAAAGGGPSEILKTLERRPWAVGDLRMLLGLDSDEEAHALLALWGFVPDAEARYRLSDADESRILHAIGQEAGWGWLDPQEDLGRARRRVRGALETGEMPRRLTNEELGLED